MVVVKCSKYRQPGHTPSLALLAERDSIESTHNIDFAVARIYTAAGESRLSGMGAPMVQLSVAKSREFLRRIQNKKLSVGAAKDVDLVGVRGVSDPSAIQGGCHVRQLCPGVRDQVIPVKGVRWRARWAS